MQIASAKNLAIKNLPNTIATTFSDTTIFGDDWDVTLEFETYRTGKKIESGVYYVNDTVTLSLVLNNPTKWNGKRRFVYLFLETNNENDFFLFHPDPEGMENINEYFPAKNEYKKRIANILVTEPLSKDKYVLLVSEKPLSIASSAKNTRVTNKITYDDIMLLSKSSPLAGDLYKLKAVGEIDFRTFTVETKPTADKAGLSVSRNGKAFNNYYIAADSTDILFSPKPIDVFDWNNFPMVDFISPKFETDTRGARILKPTNGQKMLFQGVAYGNPRSDNIKKVTVNNEPPSFYNPRSKLFEYQYELKAGLNTVEVTAEDSSGLKRSYRVKFNYTPETKKVETIAKNYLFVVGVDDYESWPKLSNGVKDAKDFTQLMIDDYGYKKENIFSLYNKDATRENILAALRNLLDKISQHDNLLIYYSGHGWYDQGYKEGYWVPVDAKRNSPSSYVENVNIALALRRINTKKTFLISDACYSGAFINTSRGDDNKTYNEKIKDYKARLVFASGGLEEVLDGEKGMNSPFATEVIKYLKTSKSPETYSTDLITHVKVAVAGKYKQTPQSGTLNDCGDEGGEFIFTRKK